MTAAPDLQQPAAPATGSSLIGLDRLKCGILKSAKFKQGTVSSTAQFREWLKSYQKEYSDLAKQVKEAVDGLAACGLLVEAGGDDQSSKKKKGRKVHHFQKAKWSDVVASQRAHDEVRRLKLSREHFNNAVDEDSI